MPGRQADAAEWLAHARCVRFPALLRCLSEEGGSYLFTPLPSLGCLLPLSEGRGAVGQVGESPAGLMFRATGHCNSLSFLPGNLLSYVASVV